MSVSIQSANVYADLQSLDRLKYSTDQDSEKTLRFVAQQFEAMFMQMMLNTAHEFDEEGGLFDGEQTEFYQDWHDKQLAIHLASGKGIGIADMLVEQLRRQDGVKELKTEPEQLSKLQFPSTNESTPGSEIGQEPISSQQQTMSLDSPESFVRQLFPMAQSAAQRLGVSPEVLLAQAALETGWGQKISQTPSGTNSHNLFNIKADGRWHGDRVPVPTVEYRDGVAVREYAHFRAYDSYQSSFDDYVSFIQNSPRYQDALEVASDSQAFTLELARAGYATDPDYSNKIMEIVEGDPLNMALATVKL